MRRLRTSGQICKTFRQACITAQGVRMRDCSVGSIGDFWSAVQPPIDVIDENYLKMKERITLCNIPSGGNSLKECDNRSRGQLLPRPSNLGELF